MSFSSKHSKQLKRLLDQKSDLQKRQKKDNVQREDTPNDRSQRLADKARTRLRESRFRSINEFLYSHSSSEAMDYMSSDLFRDYHNTYDKMADKWPERPVEHVIKEIRHLYGKKSQVIADIGCGQRARVKEAFPEHCVHSFDLVSTCNDVIEANMTSLPLEDSVVDCAVFSLSLMATNVNQCISEANRILKQFSRLIIVEVKSRLEEELFESQLKAFGFSLERKHTLSEDYFQCFRFRKTSHCARTLPDIELKPCLYKKR